MHTHAESQHTRIYKRGTGAGAGGGGRSDAHLKEEAAEEEERLKA